MLPRTLKRSPSRELLMHAGGRQTGPIISICEDNPFAAARRAAYLAGRSLADAPNAASTPKEPRNLAHRMDSYSLNRPGTVRVGKLYTLEKSLIVKTFGSVNDHTLDRIRAALAELTQSKANELER